MIKTKKILVTVASVGVAVLLAGSVFAARLGRPDLVMAGCLQIDGQGCYASDPNGSVCPVCETKFCSAGMGQYSMPGYYCACKGTPCN
jgi:hypothetical protein